MASRRPTITPAWGPPSSLSPENVTSAAPALTERRTEGSSASTSRSSASTPEPTSSITGALQLAQRLDLDLLDEAEHAEVRWVRAQDRGGALTDRVAVVRQPGAVRGADLHQVGARLGDDLGNAERAADLDQLPARHEHLGPGPAIAATESSTAPAQLLTAIAASAPVSWRSSSATWSCREPRSPLPRSSSRFE